MSSELYHIKQQFVLGAYTTLVSLPLPDPNSPDYTPTLIYQARAHIALNDPASALSILPESSENVAIKAASALAKFEAASGDAVVETALEALRDLAVEVEGECDGTESEKDLVRVLAGTAFAKAGEIEEALETLGTETEDLEAVAVIVQICLSIHRPDLAKKTFERVKMSAEDDLLLQLIESSIDLVSGKGAYNNPESFYSEQLGNPSLSSSHLLVARGVSRILKGEIPAAKSDIDEALEQGSKDDPEALAALVVVSGLGGTKKDEADEIWQNFSSKHPTHPLVVDVQQKEASFGEFASKFTVPPLAVA
ncbi:coatomer complex protein [Pterulicium gracile]|uniref:Coatomer subunit epsilon n=1 Tax=Pterulicium gracile TaxID=1884261 RepID=A0A5C3QW20_9AGAR|nr:coatomer complex protein [Pterula gracilis]